MPSYGEYHSYCPERARRIEAWMRHYMAKGCNAHKAGWLARKKWHKTSWPPSRCDMSGVSNG